MRPLVDLRYPRIQRFSADDRFFTHLGFMQTLKHSKSTMAEGLSMLLWLGLIVIVVGCFQIILFGTVWSQQRPFALGFLASEIAVGLLVLYVAMAKIRRNETFVCILDDEFIECVCPVKTRGDSFRLKLEELVRIEQQIDGERHRWYLHDRQGNRHWLTDAYCNPADTFVEVIRRLVPHVSETRN